MSDQYVENYLEVVQIKEDGEVVLPLGPVSDENFINTFGVPAGDFAKLSERGETGIGDYIISTPSGNFVLDDFVSLNKNDGIFHFKAVHNGDQTITPKIVAMTPHSPDSIHPEWIYMEIGGTVVSFSLEGISKLEFDPGVSFEVKPSIYVGEKPAPKIFEDDQDRLVLDVGINRTYPDGTLDPSNKIDFQHIAENGLTNDGKIRVGGFIQLVEADEPYQTGTVETREIQPHTEEEQKTPGQKIEEYISSLLVDVDGDGEIELSDIITNVKNKGHDGPSK